MSAAAAPLDPHASTSAAPAPVARWQREGERCVLHLEGDWRTGTAELPPVPQEGGAIVIDGSGLTGWDARLASALWARLQGARRPGEGVTAAPSLQLQGLPPGLQQVMELALPPPASGAAIADSAETGRRRWLKGVGLRAQGSWRRMRTTFEFFGDVTLALLKLLRGRGDMRAQDLAWQLEQTGPRSLPILMLVCFLVGLIVAYMGGAQLKRFGAETFVADLVTVGVVREIAALLVGIVLAGRVGAAFAAQLGSMQANDEIDALRTMGVDPISHLVLPRVLALLAVGPLLTAFGALVGMFVGWLVAVGIFEVSPLEYLNSSIEALTMPHVLIGLLKGTVYSMLVGLAGCRQGMAAGRSAQDVGDATTQAVVQGIVWVVVAASTLTVIFQRLDW